MLLELKAKKVIKDLRLKINMQQINIKYLFQKLDKSGDNSLDRSELSKLLCKVDSTLTENELAILFKQFDADGSGSVNYSEFEALISDGVSQMNHTDPNASTNMTVSDRAKHLLNRLRAAIEKNDLDIEIAFKHFDVDRNGKLDRGEFAQLVKVFYGVATMQEVKETYEYLDKDNSGSIQMTELKQIILS